MDRWLKGHGMPPITRVYKTTRDSKRLTLEQECLQSGTLPSIAYGFKRCSLKHKIGPQEKFCNHYLPCQKVWGSGQAGGEIHRLRRRRGLPQRQGAAGRPGRPQVQQVVSPDGMGMGPGGLSAGH